LLLSLAIKYAPTDNYIVLVVKALLLDWQINGFTYNKIMFQAEIKIFNNPPSLLESTCTF